MVRVNVEKDGQRRLTSRQFLVTPYSVTGHGVDETLTVQLHSHNNIICLCSNAKDIHDASFCR